MWTSEIKQKIGKGEDITRNIEGGGSLTVPRIEEMSIVKVRIVLESTYAITKKFEMIRY